MSFSETLRPDSDESPTHLTVPRDIASRLDKHLPPLYAAINAAGSLLSEDRSAAPTLVALALERQFWKIYHVLRSAGLLDVTDPKNWAA